MPTPAFSIIIPTYNRADVVARTLRHLLAQHYPPERVELFVVDNSTDATPDVVARIACSAPCAVRLLRTSERHPAVKRNRALAEASGELVLFLNDDVWAEPDLLLEHARSHAAHAPEPIAVLGHVDQSPEMPYSPLVEYLQPFAYGELAALADQPVTWHYFWTPNISLPRREMVERGLAFREDWVEIAHDDVELGYRWARAGYKLIYNPRAGGQHYHPHTLASACRLQESVGRGLPALEQVAPEPGLLERYGVFSWRNSPRAVVRGLLRQALFNAATVPLAERWLNRQPRNSRLTRWMYWKVLLHYTNRGYRQAPPLLSRRPIEHPRALADAAGVGRPARAPAGEG